MRYYSINRPVGPGTYPRQDGTETVVNFYEGKIYCEEIEREAWGYIDFKTPISKKEAESYELVKGGEGGKALEGFCGSGIDGVPACFIVPDEEAKKEEKAVPKLEYGRLTENLIEIAWLYTIYALKYQQITDIDSSTWKQEFVTWANEFEELHPDPEYWDDNDYFEAIEDFAVKKIMEFGGIELQPIYFSFGSWEKFPYQNTYVVVYAEDKHQAIQKFRKHFPDVNDGVVNCSAWYTQAEVDRCKTDGTWYDGEPAEIIR